MLRAIILVGIGGATGSILRYLTTVYVTKHLPSTFPMGTFTVNILGCFIAGIIWGIFHRQFCTSEEIKLLLITGFCGGYTTFSAFTSENMNLLQTGNMGTAVLYIIGSVIVSLLAFWVGFILIK